MNADQLDKRREVKVERERKKSGGKSIWEWGNLSEEGRRKREEKKSLLRTKKGEFFSLGIQLISTKDWFLIPSWYRFCHWWIIAHFDLFLATNTTLQFSSIFSALPPLHPPLSPSPFSLFLCSANTSKKDLPLCFIAPR